MFDKIHEAYKAGIKNLDLKPTTLCSIIITYSSDKSIYEN